MASSIQAPVGDPTNLPTPSAVASGQTAPLGLSPQHPLTLWQQVAQGAFVSPETVQLMNNATAASGG